MLTMQGSQGNLREDTLDRNPGPATRVAAAPRYAGDELDYDVAEFHEEWKKAAHEAWVRQEEGGGGGGAPESRTRAADA